MDKPRVGRAGSARSGRGLRRARYRLSPPPGGRRMTKRPDRDDSARKPSPHDPLDFILAEHLNHRRMCRALERLADAAEFDAARITAVLDFIRFDLTLHVIDEEEDVFP